MFSPMKVQVLKSFVCGVDQVAEVGNVLELSDQIARVAMQAGVCIEVSEELSQVPPITTPEQGRRKLTKRGA